MESTQTSCAETTPSRRRLIGYGIGSALVTLATAACAGMQSQPRDPNRKPHWEREEQRDD